MKKQVFIPSQGNSDMRLFSKDGSLLAVGYCRIEFGQRGPYVELDDSQIQKTAIRKVTARHTYFDEFRSCGESKTMVYFQRQTVAYAKYRIGFYYISVFDLTDISGRLIAGDRPSLFDGLATR